MKEYYYDETQEMLDLDQEEGIQIDIMEYVSKLVRSWKTVVAWGFIGSLVGLLIALGVVKTYTVRSVLVPEAAPKSNAGGMSSLAAMAGVNLGSLTSTEAIYPGLYPSIVASMPFIVEMLSMPVTLHEGHEDSMETDLYTYLDKHQKKKWYGWIASLPNTVVSTIISMFKEKEDDTDVKPADIDPSRLTYRQDFIVRRLCSKLTVFVDKKTSVITIAATMDDAGVAKQVCDEIVVKLQDYVVKYRTEKARQDVEYYQMLNDEARNDYYAAQSKYARYVDANQGITLSSFLVERERMQNEANLAYQLYNQTAQQLQLAQAKIQQETPVWITLEPSAIPVKGEPSRLRILIMIAFLFGAGSAVWVMFGDLVMGFLSKFREENKSENNKEE